MRERKGERERERESRIRQIGNADVSITHCVCGKRNEDKTWGRISLQGNAAYFCRSDKGASEQKREKERERKGMRKRERAREREIEGEKKRENI